MSILNFNQRCPECDGDGYVEADSGGLDECETCEGTGLDPACQDEEENE